MVSPYVLNVYSLIWGQKKSYNFIIEGTKWTQGGGDNKMKYWIFTILIIFTIGCASGPLEKSMFKEWGCKKLKIVDKIPPEWEEGDCFIVNKAEGRK